MGERKVLDLVLFCFPVHIYNEHFYIICISDYHIDSSYKLFNGSLAHLMCQIRSPENSVII